MPPGHKGETVLLAFRHPSAFIQTPLNKEFDDETPTETETLAARVAALPNLPMEKLWPLWDDYFPHRPSHHHRCYVEELFQQCSIVSV
jgi:hypothetical protein